VLCRLIFKLLHKKHVPPYVEVSTVLAGAYTVYLGTGGRVHSRLSSCLSAAYLMLVYSPRLLLEP
jgi:hypothetical protein